MIRFPGPLLAMAVAGGALAACGEVAGLPDGGLPDASFADGADGAPQDAGPDAVLPSLRCRGELDRSDDGSLDAVERYSYDAAGRPLLDVLDEGMDGTDDRRTRYEHDDEGRLVLLEIDAPVGGTPDHIERYTYGAPGLLTTEWNLDGVGDFDRREARVYDSGAVVRLDRDNDNDGAIDDVVAFTQHDAGGLPLFGLIDLGADGMPDRDLEATYEAGRIVEYVERAPPGGNVFVHYRWSWTDAGALLVHERDLDANGIFEYRESYVYDAGRLSELTIEGNAKPPLEARWTYSYDCSSGLALR